MIVSPHRTPRAICISLLIGIACFTGTFASFAQEDTSTIAETVVNKALPAELAEMFPIGREFKGVSIPSYSEDELSSIMNAKIVKRIDEEFLDLTGLVVKVFSGSGEDRTETIIRMERAEYHLLNGELTSKTQAVIEQPQFTMTSDQMIFESHSEKSRMIGNVIVIVPDAGSFAPNFANGQK